MTTSTAYETQMMREANAPRLRAAVLRELVPLHSVTVQLLGMFDDPKVALRDLADVAGRDVGLAAQMLRLANSVNYGLRHQVGTLLEALRVIGLREARLLVLTSGVASISAHPLTTYRMQRSVFLRHGEIVGGLARILSLRHGLPYGDGTAYTVGLLHDVGKLAIDAWAQRAEADAATVVALLQARGSEVLAAEAELCGYTHAELAALLADDWGLPSEIASVLGHHHDDVTPGTLGWCVAAANAAAGQADPQYPSALRAPWPVGLDDEAERTALITETRTMLKATRTAG